MPAYRVTGTFRNGEEWQRFTKEVAAASEEDARQHILSDIGSKHGLARRDVRLKTVTTITAEEITNPIVRHKVGRP
jgi:large subunit ribosomal protein LX